MRQSLLEIKSSNHQNHLIDKDDKFKIVKRFQSLVGKK